MTKSTFIQQYVIQKAMQLDGNIEDDILVAELAAATLEEKGYYFDS